MVWTILCWETLDHIIHMEYNWSHPDCLNINGEQIHPFLTRVFYDGKLMSSDTLHLLLQKLFKKKRFLKDLPIS